MRLLLSALLVGFLSSASAQVTSSATPPNRSLLFAVESEGVSQVPAPVLLPADERTATFVVNYTGFSSSAQTAFQYAVDIWSGLITSDVPIVIDATWEDLPGNALGSAGANNLFYNFGGAPANGVLYPSPLANKLAGSDLDPGQADISANFDSGTNWYYGLDGNTPFSQFDLVSVVLHEIGHGLGFAGTAFVGTDLNGYILNGSLPHVYDGFVWTGNSIPILDFGSGTASLGDALVSDNLYWAGAQGNAYSGDFSPKLYAPSFWEQGSSYSHFDESTYPAGNAHSLMTPQIGNGEAIHSPGAMCLGVLEDIGWTVDYDALDGPVGAPGCTDAAACNYDPEATLSDGSCIYPLADEPCGDCTSLWSMALNASAGQGVEFTFGGVGSIDEIEVAVQWAGSSNGEWVSDLLVLLCDPNGDCFEWGGFDQTTGATAAGVDWPAAWDTGAAGTYTVTLNVSGLDLSGLGTWSVSLFNGFGDSGGLDLTDVTFTVPYVCPLTGLNPGCTDNAACNYEPSADYNDGSCNYFCFNCTETLLFENFQSYDTTVPLTVQATNGWETWSGIAGGVEDPYVVLAGADAELELVSPEVDPSQASDVVFPIGASDGQYVVQFSMSTQAGQTAYYNFQGDNTPGIEWTLETFIDTEGGLAFVQGEDTLQADGFQVGADNLFTHIFDLDNDELRVILGTQLVALLEYPGNLGGVNFYAYSFGGGLGRYLLDDLTICASTTAAAGCMDSQACNYNPDAVEDDGSCLFPFDYGWCDCEGSVFDALGECGGGCAEDLDADGICDSEDPCIGGVLDACGVCDGPGAVFECGCEDIPEDDCDCDGNQLDALGECGGDCAADVNGDGICDVPGCTDMEACNYDPLANTDDGGCEYAVLYYDCSGDCINDSDGDGVCDELEVSGCTDSEACNYDDEASEDDGSCAYLTAASIDGSAEVDEGSTQLYVAMPSEPGNSYTWAVSGGSLLSGQGTSLVTVEWTTSGAHSIQVVETNASCTGGVINLDVDVLEVTSIDEFDPMDWAVWPNPARTGFRIDVGSIQLRLCDLSGAEVRQWPTSAPRTWHALDGVAPGMYLLEVELPTGKKVRPLVVAR
ncbi:MAG TPA: hypothetical protein DHV07_02405 [Flavobacteriales bacterium]|jgi:hypothetical protein|nr:hypothetical protein [Flavobacteriales bacterium]